MNHLVKTSLLLLALTLGAGTLAHAQTADPGQAPAPRGQWQGKHHGPMDPNRQTRMLTKKLGLSSDQAAQIEPILASRDQQLKALHDSATSGTASDPKSLHKQMRGINQEAEQKLEAILTDTQKQQYQQMLAERRHGHKGPGTQQPPTNPGL
jgi:Spy/CpxP family protein refolding chaperone